MSKVEQLLSILNMDEMEQAVALYNLGHDVVFNRKRVFWNWISGEVPGLKSLDNYKDLPYINEERLALLAFELREEFHHPIGLGAWDRACWEVWKYVMIQFHSNIFERKHLSITQRERYCYHWMAFWAKPKHQVVAALVAKEIETNPEEKFDDHLVSEYEPEIRVVKYAIGQDDGKGGYGMWDGPNPSLKEMLDVEGRDGNSVLIRFNADGTDEVLYRWTCSEWMKVISNADLEVDVQKD